jgi:hypothetical protein
MKNTDCELHGWYPTTQGLCPTCSACKERDELRAEVERLRGVSILVQSPSHEEFLRMRVEMGALREALAKSELQNDELVKAYKTMLENLCQRQDDFTFWHGKLLDVLGKSEKQHDAIPAYNCNCLSYSRGFHHEGCPERKEKSEPQEMRVYKQIERCQKCGVAHEPKEQPFCSE